MKTVHVDISSDDKSDNSATSITHEVRKGDIWNRESGRDHVTNKDKPATFKLKPGERLVIEAYPDSHGAVYDRDQATASPKPQTQNPVAAEKGASSRPNTPVGQAVPRPTTPGPDNGPETMQDRKAAGVTNQPKPGSH